jgi:hypothetical protein
METFVPSGWFSPSLFVLSKLQSHTNKFPQLWHLKWSIASDYTRNQSGVVNVSVTKHKSLSRQTRNPKCFDAVRIILFCFVSKCLSQKQTRGLLNRKVYQWTYWKSSLDTVTLHYNTKWNSLIQSKSMTQHCDQNFIRHQTYGDKSVLKSRDSNRFLTAVSD